MGKSFKIPLYKRPEKWYTVNVAREKGMPMSSPSRSGENENQKVAEKLRT